MSVKTSQAMAISFCVKASAGTPVDADSLPTAKLRKNGTDQGTSVTVAKVSGASSGDGQYVASWTQPTTAAGDIWELLIDPVVATVDYGWQATWEDVGDTKFVGDLNDIAATDIVSDGAITTSGGLAAASLNATNVTGNVPADMTVATATVTLNATQGSYAPSKAGDAMALTSGERTTLAAVIWNALTSGMTTAGSIGLKLANWIIGMSQTGDAYARLGAPAGASVSADILELQGGMNAIAPIIEGLVNTDGKLWVLNENGDPLASSAALASLQSHGDASWATATGFALASTWTSGLASTISTNLNATVSSRMPAGAVEVGSYASGQDPATLVLDCDASSHASSGTIGAKINAGVGSPDVIADRRVHGGGM